MLVLSSAASTSSNRKKGAGLKLKEIERERERRSSPRSYKPSQSKEKTDGRDCLLATREILHRLKSFARRDTVVGDPGAVRFLGVLRRQASDGRLGVRERLVELIDARGHVLVEGIETIVAFLLHLFERLSGAFGRIARAFELGIGQVERRSNFTRASIDDRRLRQVLLQLHFDVRHLLDQQLLLLVDLIERDRLQFVAKPFVVQIEAIFELVDLFRFELAGHGAVAGGDR